MRYRYTECKSDGSDYTMLGITGLVCAELGIDPPGLFYMRESNAGEKACHEDAFDVRGIACHQEQKVFVRADIDSRDMIQTLAHELRHIWQVRKGHVSPNSAHGLSKEAYCASPAERDAVAYGKCWYERIPISYGAKLHSGLEPPSDVEGKRMKRTLSYRTNLYYLDLKGLDLYFCRDNGTWRLKHTVELFDERAYPFNWKGD